jgi:hypothetical protein
MVRVSDGTLTIRVEKLPLSIRDNKYLNWLKIYVFIILEEIMACLQQDLTKFD